ncbi:MULTISPECIES: DUF732 domain-containing protein [Mycolicibacterium]|uniref:DUF732 domain-containing protein n=1 Tax=Mycolicibacterium TaxID=1866885 RepID=UPI000939BEA1|nr:DUF732 domain-containing protein [Mycolicibacterium mageritense]MBN3455132.1 DUF732 domain-containing protein [Mycobacterium sp. DSM 3803]OKH66930.1 hypothetical protein EB73_18960 [Mycobacterium sp. SWH-M3]GJJ17863.1 hypothetical protein MTY414_15360 [Mycolicibacterium mageritense]
MLSLRSPRHLPARVIATALSACALFAAMAFGIAPAHASTEDDRFLEIVKQLNVPMNSPEEAIQAGHGICDKVAAGKIEPARTVRSILSQLTSNGLEKGVAVNLIWGAVDVYCPQYRSLVGR